MKAIISAAVLEKIARHLALLACLAVVFKANGWSDAAEAAILVLAVMACLAHLTAGWLKGPCRPGPGR